MRESVDPLESAAPRRPWTGVVVYTAVAWALGALCVVLMRLGGWQAGAGPGALFVLALMWVPALARLVATRTVDRGWVPPLRVRRWGRPRAWVVVWPLCCVTGVYLLAYGAGIALGWSAWAPREHTAGGIALNVAFNAVTAVALGLPGALGEELGWRGYLQPRLDQLELPASVPVVAVIELVYHVPVILLGGYLATEGAWVWAALIFVAAKICGSFLWAHASYAFGSLWPAIWFHAIHNGFSQAVFPRLFSGGDDQLRLGEAGLLPMVASAVAAALIVLWMTRRGQTWRSLAQRAVG
jgi:membrane protease YdiL (CAAX protease family)